MQLLTHVLTITLRALALAGLPIAGIAASADNEAPFVANPVSTQTFAEDAGGVVSLVGVFDDPDLGQPEGDSLTAFVADADG